MEQQQQQAASSWDSWLDSMKSQNVDICGIMGIDGNCWAKSPNCTATPEEMSKLAKVMRDNDINVLGDGVTFCGKGWTGIRFEDGILLTKGKKDESKKNLVVCKMGAQCVTFGSCSDGDSYTLQHIRAAVVYTGTCLKDLGY